MNYVNLIVIILLLSLNVGVRAGELPPPTPRKDRPVADELYLRRIQQEWNNDVITTTNPNGNIRGQAGDRLLYNNGGSYKPCWNISSGIGTDWRCNANTLTAP